jgi:nucleotide-binding universal stress UspA family protein
MSINVQRVLVATDFSRAGQRAVEVAADWARLTRAQLRIVHVAPPKSWLSETWGLGSSAADAIARHATNALRQTADNVNGEPNLELSTGLLSGAAARSIAHAASDYRADLLVTGARGERDADGERVLGGTSAKLLSAVEIPLLLVRRTRQDPIASVVAAVDLSPRSHAVLEWAGFAAAERPLHAYHAYDVPFTSRLAAYGLSSDAIGAYREQARAQRETELATLVASTARAGATTHVVEHGDAAVLLGRYIESVRPSLVVVGKHMRRTRSSPGSSVGSVCRFVAGSVSADVLAV